MLQLASDRYDIDDHESYNLPINSRFIFKVINSHERCYFPMKFFWYHNESYILYFFSHEFVRLYFLCLDFHAKVI